MAQKDFGRLLYFMSTKTSTSSSYQLDILATPEISPPIPRTAATIQEDYKDWPTIQGIQLEGVVRLLAGSEREVAIATYSAKYPFIAQADLQIQAALARVNWYELQPDKLYFIDNSKGLGHRDEIQL